MIFDAQGPEASGELSKIVMASFVDATTSQSVNGAQSETMSNYKSQAPAIGLRLLASKGVMAALACLRRIWAWLPVVRPYLGPESLRLEPDQRIVVFSGRAVIVSRDPARIGGNDGATASTDVRGSCGSREHDAGCREPALESACR